MTRRIKVAECLLTSLGLAMLVLSIILVPSAGLLADTGGVHPLTPQCTGNGVCNTGCTISLPDKGSCIQGCAGGADCTGCVCGLCAVPMQPGVYCACFCTRPGQTNCTKQGIPGSWQCPAT